MKINPAPLQCPCEAGKFSPVFRYTAPPQCEVRFAFSSGEGYRREVSRCDLCGHFVSVHQMDMSGLYAGAYVDANYGDSGIARNFERIISLDPGQSDNAGRVQRIIDFADNHFSNFTAASPRTILDVGSGLCVFLHRMKAAGWVCTALDPDPRAAAHARDRVGVSAICGDFMELSELGTFDVITFNKVLEHVADPVGMLARSADFVRAGGFVYVELPDGEAAAQDGPEREEFAIDHLHVFSGASFAMLAERAGFRLQTLERLREPSTKYTWRGFLIPRQSEN